MKAVLVLPFLFVGVAGPTTVVMAQSAGTFTATGDMTTERHGHTATLLANGKVLIAGGTGNRNLFPPSGFLASAELYDPGTGTFTPTGEMTMARPGSTATLLADGRVLIAGNYGTEGSRAELYDPSTGRFTATGDMLTRREWNSAILLGNGKVLIVGGGQGGAELYDPATGTFAATGAYAHSDGVYGGGATLLPDGRVLIVGIADDIEPELYDPSTGTFSLTGIVSAGLADRSTTSLMNGEVLITGGDDACDGPGSSAELYNSSTGTFTAIGNMTTSRGSYKPALLPDGTVLIAGGFQAADAILASSELYDPATGIFSATENMTRNRDGYTATLLPNGKVLVAGGASPVYWANTSSAELYEPPLLVLPPVLLSLSGDGIGQGAIQHAGTLRIASADDPAMAGEYLSIYLTGLADGGLILPQVAIGGRLAEVTFFGNVPGYPGLNVINVRMPNGVAPGPAVPVRLNYIGRPSNEVTIGLR